MSTAHEPDEEPALITLLKDVVDALGTLIAGHVRLARAELGDDARRYARRGALVAGAASLVLVGYGLCCVSAALALARLFGPPLAFLAIGAAHLAGASAALRVLVTRPAPPALDESLSALDSTVAALTLNGARPEAVAIRPERGRDTRGDIRGDIRRDIRRDEDLEEDVVAQEGVAHVAS